MRKVKKTLYFSFILIIWMVLLMSVGQIDQAQAVPTSYYVKGDTGLDTNPGTLASPYKTIQKCATVMVAGDTCYIRAGVYREPTIIPVNSGTSSTNQIKFAAYNGESVTISGADLITGWTPYSGSIYQAPMAWNMTSIVVFVDGVWAGEAKWPNNSIGSDILNPASWAVVDSATANPATEYTITDAALSSFASGYWDGATVVSIAGVSYGAYQSTITSFANSTLNFAPWASGSSFYAPAVGDLYYITNSLKALDTANEWYKDSVTNTLYLMVSGGGSPSGKVIEAKKRDFTFDLSNKSYIEVNGINMRAASINTNNSTNNVKIIGVKLQGATQSLLGTNNEIRNSEISNTQGTGIGLYGQNNSIINNYIHDINFAASNGSAGITLSGKNQLISHNTVSRAASHLLMGTPISSVIQYNNIYDAAILTEDVGIVYLGNADYDNTEVHHNWFHDNKSIKSSNAMGFYLDNYTSNLIAYQNVIWNAADSGVRINAPYSFHLFYNNSIYNKSNLVTQLGNGFGTQYMNNIIYDGLGFPSNVTTSNNFTFGDPKYVNPALNDFHLQTTSPAKDRGRTISGVTTGTAPDIGAYEVGGTNWTPGHNFTTLPSPVYALNSSLEYKNKLPNAGFEDSSQLWNTITGSPENIKNSSWEYGSKAMTNMHANSTGLKSGDRIEKTVTGLLPNTTYTLSGYGKIDGKFIQAETCNTCFQAGTSHWVALPNNIFRSSTYIGPLQDGDYLGFNSINFNNLYDRIELGLNSTKLGGSVEVRLDSTTGTLLGTLSLANYYANWKFQEILFSSAVSGTHNLYLVFKGVGLGDLALLDSIMLKHITMTDSMNIGVKNYKNGGSNSSTPIISPASWVNGVVLFTTGATDTSATIYVDKPLGSYVGYIDNLGVVQAYLPVGVSFYDSFENGFGNWSSQVGPPSASTTQMYSGNSSYVLDQDVDYIQRTFASSNKVVVVRFYDDAADTSMQSLAYVDNSVTNIALGVATGTSPYQYVYRINNTTFTSSLVNRSTGWHEFTFDYRSGNDVKLYIDGILVVSSSSSTSFNRIFLGDAWGGSSGTVYFDDISVQDALPFTISEGFESGFGNWNTQVGPPTASTTQKHSGNSSYVLDQDIDYIQRTFTSNNKVAVVWFYDDAADTSMQTVAFVDDSVTSVGLGVVKTGTSSPNNYTYTIGGNTWISSIVNRSTGWHQFTFDYRSGVDVKMYIDGVYVAYSTSVTSFNRIFLGDAWGSNIMGTVYFDDVVVRDDLPFKLPLFWDGFENGFANWLPQNGTASTSTTQKYNMNYSYALDQDQDSIVHSMPTNTNKVAVVWFYDDAADPLLSMTAVAFVDDSVTITALGVVTATSSANYIYRVGGAWIASTIPRTTGWHKFTFDYRSRTDVKLYIDGTLVATSTASTFFKRIYLGDAWSGSSGNVYFDDVSVQDNLLP